MNSFAYTWKGEKEPLKLIDKAITFAAVAHDGQMRKAANIPYIAHPYAVGLMLLKENCSEETVAAGILHDTLEDTAVTYEQLVKEFGERVASLVQAVSEPDKSLPWEERKEHTIHSLKEASLEVIQIITADKLHNLRSIRLELKESGEKVWARFNRGKEKQKWYYTSIVKEMRNRQEQFPLIKELEKEVRAVFGPF